MAKLSWPAHRVVAGVRLLIGWATHPGKAHPSVDRRLRAAIHDSIRVEVDAVVSSAG